MVKLRKFFKVRGKKQFAWSMWKWLKRYLANSSVHGVRYLVEDGRHWTERIFWFVCCGLSWWGCIVMVSAVYADFSNHPIATTVETNYLNWKTELPSMHVCYTYSYKSHEYTTKIWTNGNSGKLTNIQTLGYQPRLKGPTDPALFYNLTKTVLLPCEDTFDFCEWNNVKVNCCQIFHPLWSMQGYCHSVNSIFTKPPKDSAVVDDSYFTLDPMGSGVFTVVLRIHNDSKSETIFILDKRGLPTITTGLEARVNSQWKVSTVKLEVTQVPTYNEEGVRAAPIKKRNCRYTDEVENVISYEYHTYDACLAEVICNTTVGNENCNERRFETVDLLAKSKLSCPGESADAGKDNFLFARGTAVSKQRSLQFLLPTEHGVILRNMIRRCGCVTHLFPVKDFSKVCDLKGLSCLANAVPPVVSTVNATCAADCEETIYTMFQRVKRNSQPGRIDLHLLPGPSLRYRRYVAHSKLDLVVAVGGAIGLFVGASILSIVEIPYWLIIRAFDDDDDSEDLDRARSQDDRRNSVTSRASYSPRGDRHFA